MGFLNLAVSAALGGAGVAANDMGESVLLNPALVAHSSKVALGAFYQPRANTFNFQQAFGFSLIDNHTNATFPGGAAYFRNSDLPGYKRQEHFHLLTGRFIKGQLAAGVSLTHVRTSGEPQTSPPDAPPTTPVRNPGGREGGGIIRVGEPVDLLAVGDGSDKLWTQWNMAVGLHWNPWPQLALAAVYDNILPEPQNLPVDIQRPPRVTLGLMHLATDYFRWRMDASHQVNKVDTFKMAGGVEILMRRFFSFRAGTHWDRKKFTWSGGVGFVGPRFHLNYAWLNFKRHSFNLLIFF